MKDALILLLLLSTCHVITAQDSTKGLPIRIGYFSAFAYQPGAKIGTESELKRWDKETEHFTKEKSLFISPQIGFFSRPNLHFNLLFNTSIGYKRVKSKNQRYSAWSIGLGYLYQSQIVEWQVNLSDGSKEKVRENWNWFLPTLNYEFGKAINERISWYSQFSYGLKIASSRSNSSLLFLELGIKYQLK